MSTTQTRTRQKRRVDGVTQRYHVSTVQPSNVSADEIIAERAARRAAGEAALSRIAYTNVSDSLRADLVGEMTGAIGETPAETRARKLQELRAARAEAPVVISFEAHGLEADRPEKHYADLGFYDSVEAAVREVTGVAHPTSTGSNRNVWFWGLAMNQTKAEAVRDEMHARGWAQTEIKYEEDPNDLDFA